MRRKRQGRGTPAVPAAFHDRGTAPTDGRAPQGRRAASAGAGTTKSPRTSAGPGAKSSGAAPAGSASAQSGRAHACSGSASPGHAATAGRARAKAACRRKEIAAGESGLGQIIRDGFVVFKTARLRVTSPAHQASAGESDAMTAIHYVDVSGYPAPHSPYSHAVVANGFVFPARYR